MPEIVERLTAALADRYAIERQIGQGGMATVYLAEDLKHHRKVAVKVLRPELAAVLGGDRFLKEIEVTANLQHPNILPLFDSGVADGFLYYVMPFIEGESLRDRLDREKQLPVNDVVEIASEVAGALDYAHRHGVIHRDIKPENILLHEGRALVADFGIALALTQAGGTRITETGLSLGTPDYMSPEQATADRDLDGRSDVYSLGAVTYEMLTGDPPHTANTVRAIIAKIVSDPPAPIGRTRSTVPPNVDAAVQTALAKSPADRFPTAARLAEALSDPGYTLPTVAAVAAATGWRHRAIGPLVILAAVLLIAALWGWLRQPEGTLPVIRYTLALPDAERLVPTFGPSIALSPDGARLVYVGLGEGGRQLWLRERDQLDGVPLPGTEGALQPFFAPDGERVAFITEDRQLRVVPLAGGPPLTLVDSALEIVGGSWGADGYVYVTSAATRGLVRVAATGGSAPESVTQVRTSLRVDYHAWPHALPNGKGVLFTIFRDHLDDEVAVVDLATGEHQVLVQGDLARYLPTGHLLYVRSDGAMLAVPFDQDQLRVTGPPVLLGTLPNFVQHDVAVSASGRMAWVRRPASINQVVWVDRLGVEAPIDPEDPVTGIRYMALSPDGRQLAVSTLSDRGGGADYGHVWIKQLPRGPLSRFTFEGAVNFRPSWTPDGLSVLFISDRGDNRDVWIRLADGSAPAELLIDEEEFIDEASFSGNGEWLVYRRGKEDGQRDIYALRVGQDSVGRPLVNSDFDEVAPALSPDGRWLAYVSVESGEPNVYVRPFPSADAQWRVSTNGGTGPVWARNGSELFYSNGADEMIAVTVRPGSTFQHGQEQVLFSTGPYRTNFYHQDYDVAADGRFVMIRRHQSDTVVDEMVVVENWFEEVKARMAKQ